MIKPCIDLYEVLDVTSDADLCDIRAAFKRQALSTHPDKGGTKEAFQNVLLAFQILSNSAHRSRYDKQVFPARDSARKQVQVRSGNSTKGQSYICKRQKTFQGNADQSSESKSADKLHVPTSSRFGGVAQSSDKKPKENFVHKGMHELAQSSFASPPNATAVPINVSPFVPTCPPAWQNAAQNIPDRMGKTSSQKMSLLMSTLCSLLRLLPPIRRRMVLQQKFTQQQRLALETWMVAQTPASGAASSVNSAQPFCSEIVAAQLSAIHVQSESSTDDNMSDISDTSSGDSSLGFFSSSATSAQFALCDTSLQDFSSPIIDCSHERNGSSSMDLLESSLDKVPVNERGEHKFEINDEAPGGFNAAEFCTLTWLTSDAAEENEDARQTRSNRGGVPGMLRQVRGSKTWYGAFVTVNRFRFYARHVADLTVALDYFAALTDMKHQICNNCTSCFQVRVEQAVHSVLVEYKISAEEMGLHFNVPVRWCGLILYTPCYYDLNHALEAWKRLDDVWSLAPKAHSRHYNLQFLHTLHGYWPKLRAAYIDILTETSAKTNREEYAARLDKLWLASAANRDKQVEWCNRLAMSAEERQQKRAERQQKRADDQLQHDCRRELKDMQAEEFYQKRFARWERRQERQNRHAMLKAERQQRADERLERRLELLNRRQMAREDVHARALKRKCLKVEDGIVNQIAHSLCTWQKLRDIEAKRQARRQELLVKQERLAKAKQERAKAKQERWRWTNRRDMTMAELFKGRI